MANSLWTTLPYPFFCHTTNPPPLPSPSSLTPLPHSSHVDSFQLRLLYDICKSPAHGSCREPAPYRLSTASSSSCRCHAAGWLREGAMRRKRRRRRRGGRGGGWREVQEHCSADKWMQQSRHSRQHTPSLSRCRHRLAPSRADRLPRRLRGSSGGVGRTDEAAQLVVNSSRAQNIGVSCTEQLNLILIATPTPPFSLKRDATEHVVSLWVDLNGAKYNH